MSICVLVSNKTEKRVKSEELKSQSFKLRETKIRKEGLKKKKEKDYPQMNTCNTTCT
jgi:hypothetical protein